MKPLVWAATLPLLLPVAFAQQASSTQTADNSGGIAEVVVTARKVTEKLEDVPVAISVISAAQIENSGAQGLRDIIEQTPGVTVAGATASEAYENIEIRGEYDINGYALSGGSPNVPVFLDGIYLQNSNAVSLGLLGLDRVEVVKGPESALYGRNAFAGAVNYVSTVPSDVYHADGKAEFGRFGTETAQGYLSGPIAPGILRVGVGYNFQYSPGDYEDPDTQVRAGGYEKRDFKINFDFTPFEDLDVRGGYYHGSDHFDQDPLVHAANNCLGGTYQCGLYVAQPIEIAPIPASSQDSGLNREVQSANLKINYDARFADISYLGGYNHVASREYEDFSSLRNGLTFQLTPGPGTANVFELFGDDDNSLDSSHELRITSKQNQPIRWAAGFDYFQSTLDVTTLIGEDGEQIPAGQSINSAANFDLAGFFVTPTGSPSTSNYTLGVITEKSYSAFASLEYDILSSLTVGAEDRQTYDRQTLDIQRNSFITNVFEPFGPIAPAGWHYNNYRGFVKYKLTPDTMAYASIATGTKAGGFNTQALGNVDQTYDPEKNHTYELGVKTQLLDHRLQIDADVYHIVSTGLQTYIPIENGINQAIANVGGTTNTGFELAGIFKPISALTLSLSGAYTDPKYATGSLDVTDAGICAAIGSACPAPLVTKGGIAYANLAGLELPRVSKVTVNSTVDYSQTIVDGYQGFVHVDYRWESRQFNTTDLLDDSWITARSILNTRLGVREGPYSVSFFITNLLNDKTPDAPARSTELNNLGFLFLGSLPTPRVYGISLTAHL